MEKYHAIYSERDDIKNSRIQEKKKQLAGILADTTLKRLFFKHPIRQIYKRNDTTAEIINLKKQEGNPSYGVPYSSNNTINVYLEYIEKPLTLIKELDKWKN